MIAKPAKPTSKSPLRNLLSLGPSQAEISNAKFKFLIELLQENQAITVTYLSQITTLLKEIQMSQQDEVQAVAELQSQADANGAVLQSLSTTMTKLSTDFTQLSTDIQALLAQLPGGPGQGPAIQAVTKQLVAQEQTLSAIATALAGVDSGVAATDQAVQVAEQPSPVGAQQPPVADTSGASAGQ